MKLPRSFALGAFLALLLVAAFYANSLDNGFHFDDQATIQNNAYIRSLRNLPRFFGDARSLSTSEADAHYRPLYSLSLALDYYWGGGLNPRAMHATQLLLHLVMTGGVLLLYRRLLPLAGFPGPTADLLALAGAVAWGLHPLGTEIVNYLSARMELLAALGALWSLVAWLAWPLGRRTGLWLLPMAAGMLSKPVALVAPGLWLAGVLLVPGFRKPGDGNGRRRVAATGAAAFILAAAGFVLIRSLGSPYGHYGGGNWTAYLRSQSWSWLRYLGLFAIPKGLCADYPQELIASWADPRVLGGLGVLAALALSILVYALRRPGPGRLCAFGAAWFALALLPSSSVIPLSEVTREYRVYLPSVGLMLCLLAAAGDIWTGARRMGWRVPLALGAAGWVLFLGVASHRRNLDWRDDLVMWRSVVRASPRSARAWVALGRSCLVRNDLTGGREALEEAARLGYDSPVFRLNWAMLEMAGGNLPAAGEHLRQALLMAPNDADAHFGQALWLLAGGDAEGAIGEFRIGLRLSPGHLGARHRLLGLYRETGRTRDWCRLAGETLALEDNAVLAGEWAGMCGGAR